MKVITAAEAAKLVRAGDNVLVSGSGGGHAIPESILAAIEKRFLDEGEPRDLCLIVGIGGFINISQNARKVVFSGTFTAGGLKVDCSGGSLRILSEGRTRRFVPAIEQICYNASFAEQQGRTAVFVTERAVFRAVDGALEPIEIAPSVDLERDVVSHMAARPRVSANLQIMDRRLFAPEPMGLLGDMHRKQEAGASARTRRLQAII